MNQQKIETLSIKIINFKNKKNEIKIIGNVDFLQLTNINNSITKKMEV